MSVDNAGYAWLYDNTFEDNVALYLDGGALRLTSINQLELTRNLFALNLSNQSGGAMWLDSSNMTEAVVQNNLWIENEADSGGAVALNNSAELTQITNNTFAGNSAQLNGAHLYLSQASVSYINNLAMYGQDGAGLFALDSTSATESDFYYNGFFQNTGGNSGGFLANLLTQTGNTSEDPLVYAYSVDGVIDNDNVHLQLISPLRNTGDPGIFDVDGSRSDIGVYGGLNAAAFDNDGDGYFDITDCDDTLSSVYPSAPEVPYDGIDQDCLNGDLVDVDGDGYDADLIGGTDCDDSQSNIYPGALDNWYDGIDSNCDYQSDYDADQDGHDWNIYGGNDCDDSNASIGPTMQELWYDGADQNCDGLSDYDADYDGQDAQGYGGDDCDESDSSIYLGAPEVPYDGIDQNCDGDDLIDADFDGWIGLEAGGADCNDTDALVYPGAVEQWYDGIDQDCAGDDDFDSDGDGQQSSQFGGQDCNDLDPAIYAGAIEVWYDGIDQDCDGLSDFDADGDGQIALEYSGDDCNDSNPSIYLGATEVWYDGIDQDCLGGNDYDADGDGFNFDINPTDNSDCDDTQATVYPGAEELLDGLDNDCNGYLETDDQDNDGLMDWHEWTLGSDAFNPDSDQDSRLDGDEVSQFGEELVPFDT
ncbi:MAG: putative metal-binding motif-containing protein, partial [Myxococcota bacterium]|nr:putative metal-binding motif-containing protein [Myxococcota bacterium]